MSFILNTHLDNPILNKIIENKYTPLGTSFGSPCGTQKVRKLDHGGAPIVAVHTGEYLQCRYRDAD